MAEGFKERYDQYMVGRNGGDAISSICLVVALVLVILSFFVVGINPFLYVLVLFLGIAAAVYAVFRMTSTDIAKRQEEVDALFGRSGSSKRSSRREPAREARTSRRSRQEESWEQDSWEQDEFDQEPTGHDAWEQDSEPMVEEEPEPVQPEKILVECEECGQKLSVPTGRGNIRVTCPRCSNQFTMHS